MSSRQPKFIRNDLKQSGNALVCGSRELSAAAPPVDFRLLAANLDDELALRVVGKRARVADPASTRFPREPLRSAAVRHECDTGGFDVLEADNNFLTVTLLVPGDFVRDEFLLEALQMKVFAVAQQLLAVLLVADMDGVTAKEMEELGENVGGAAGNLGREDGGRAEKALTGQSGEDLAGGGEEYGEAEGEVIRRVAG